MKKILLPFLGLMLVLNSCNKDAIYGNGQIKTEHRNLTSFSKIDVIGDFDLKIIKAPGVLGTNQRVTAIFYHLSNQKWKVVRSGYFMIRAPSNQCQV